jgi:hypothetical protein
MIGSIFIASQHVDRSLQSKQVIVPIKITTSARHSQMRFFLKYYSGSSGWIAKLGTLARTCITQSMLTSWPGGVVVVHHNLLGNNAQLDALTMLLLTAQNTAQLSSGTQRHLSSQHISKFSLNRHRDRILLLQIHAPRTTHHVNNPGTLNQFHSKMIQFSTCAMSSITKLLCSQWWCFTDNFHIH